MTAILDGPTPLLGGLSPAAFMRRFWQRRPLLVRQALPDLQPLIGRRELFALARRDDVESRLVIRDGGRWIVRPGPLPTSSLPKLSQPGWTMLVQGVDLHVAAARALLDRFRFVPEARLDDLMLSWASSGGGVGPHVDSYDVFLLQVAGQRRWRIGRVHDDRLLPGLPLKILARFESESDWLLDPGDMLYVPPGWAHDGVAVGACTTASIGFRSPAEILLAGELLSRLADVDPAGPPALYRDAGAAPTATPGCVPPRLQAFARRAVQTMLAEPQAVERALGEYLSEPKPQVWFRSAAGLRLESGVTLASASRMMYDMHHVFINGESLRASGRDATLMHQLADRRGLEARHCARASAAARALLCEWLERGWLVPGVLR